MSAPTATINEGLFRTSWRGRPYLLSPVLDFLMSGGGALLFLIMLVLTVPYTKSSEEDVFFAAVLAGTFATLAYVVNYPHFMVSYQLLYRNLPERLRTLKPHKEMWLRLINAAFLVPIVLLVLMYLAYDSARRGDMSWFAYSFQAMFFFVGWHYTKQAFGTFMVLSALKKIFHTPLQRRILLINAYTVWLCSWVYLTYTSQFLGVQFQQGFLGSVYSEYGFQYFEMPASMRLAMLILTALTTLAFMWAIADQWKKTGKRPSVTALTSYLSMYYLWGFVTVLHPEWVLFAPFFHSLQYLLFIFAYKRGEVRVAMKEQGLPENAEHLPEFRPSYRKIRNHAQNFLAFSFLLGVIFFTFIPGEIDAHFSRSAPGLLPNMLFIMLFSVFINIHHYFIDNVIWRRENPDVGRNLFSWRNNS